MLTNKKKLFSCHWRKKSITSIKMRTFKIYYYYLFFFLIFTQNIYGQGSYVETDSAVSYGKNVIDGGDVENSKFSDFEYKRLFEQYAPKIDYYFRPFLLKRS